MTVRIRRSGDTVILEAPYCPEMPLRAKELGGKWNGTHWQFDARDEARVRQMARAIYGTDGEDGPELVTIRLTITRNEAYEREIWLAGRMIARRPLRDAPVRLGDKVVVAEGRFPPSGGSMKHPALGGEGVVLEIRDVPRRVVPEQENIQILDGHNQAEQSDTNDPLKPFSDEQLIAEIERRGYVVIRTATQATQP